MSRKSQAEYSRAHRRRMAKRRAADPAFAEAQRKKWRKQALRHRAYHRAYCKAYNAGYYDAHRDKILEQCKAYKAAHPEKAREWANRYARSEKGRRNAKELMRGYRASLTDRIVRQCLNKHHGWDGIEIPQEVIETKRVQLELIREIRNGNRQPDRPAA